MTRLVVKKLTVPIGRAEILKDVSFAAEGGQLIGLVGPNGAGKSTLLRALARLLRPTAGSITLNGKDVLRMPGREAARSMAYLAQGDTVHWPLAAEVAVSLGRAPHVGPLAGRSAADHAAIERAMELTGVTAMRDRDVTRLSGGERARVLLARSLAVEAPVLLADEPVGALDPRHGLNIMALLREQAAGGTLVIVVLHDLVLASRFCDRLIVLGGGRVVADGAPGEVLGPAAIEQHYAVSGHYVAHDDENFVVPWRALPRENFGEIEGEIA
ncbi:MAG: fecE [Novosphingobium sp.]|nr:fecE [Novosphingobium sp.]